MGHSLDFIEHVRAHLAPAIGGFLTGVRHRELHEEEFVGYVEMDTEEFEEKLHEMDFHRNPLAYWKTYTNFDGEDGSWRWVEDEWQLHVMYFDGRPGDNEHDGERTYVFAHWEYRWDYYPFKHLRGTDSSISKGVNRMRTKLNLASVPFYDDPLIRDVA